MDAALVTINLRSFTKQIREDKVWKENKHNAITVIETEVMRIVLIALQKDAEMIEYTEGGMLSIHRIEGQILFTIQ